MPFPEPSQFQTFTRSVSKRLAYFVRNIMFAHVAFYIRLEFL